MSQGQPRSELLATSSFDRSYTLVPTRDPMLTRSKSKTSRTEERFLDSLQAVPSSSRDHAIEAPDKKRARLLRRSGWSSMPGELLYLVAEHLDPWALWNCRAINRAWLNMVYSYADAYRCLSLSDFISTKFLKRLRRYTILPRLPASIKAYLLPHTRHLSLSDLTVHPEDLDAFLGNVAFHHLLELDLTFCATASERSIEVLAANSVQLSKLVMRGCAMVHDGVRIAAAMPSLQHLDLSWSTIETLPSSFKHVSDRSPRRSQSLGHVQPTAPPELATISSANKPFGQLKTLDLSGATRLRPEYLQSFFADMPESLEELSLCHLTSSTLSTRTLEHLTVSIGDGQSDKPGKPRPTALRHIDLRGIDHLTRQDVRRLSSKWAQQRSECSKPSTDGGSKEDASEKLSISHNALLLESDDFLGYQQFVRMIADAAVIVVP